MNSGLFFCLHSAFTIATDMRPVFVLKALETHSGMLAQVLTKCSSTHTYTHTHTHNILHEMQTEWVVWRESATKGFFSPLDMLRLG